MQTEEPILTRRNAAMLLGLGTLILYARTIGFGFVILDDPGCVQLVPQITAGLTWQGIVWAFTDGITDAHWKPLTVLSHMLDCELYGLNAGGHHATNVLLHTASALVLFAALHRMTGAPWRSWLVAAIFAWHPLHVESVAWITERKDVLYGFFWMVALWAYARYTEAPSIRRYAVVAAACTASFLSKSMAVTLPCALVLLDFWPLRRVRLPWLKDGDGTGTTGTIPLPRAVLEKVPLVALAVATTLVAMAVLRTSNALGANSETTPSLRIANALVSYVRYVGMTLWPADLAVYYPLPRSIPLWQPALALVALLVATGFAVAQARRRPWLLVGWLWYLGAVTPVIGFIQPSWAACADRYTYIPQVGLALGIVWAVEECFRAPGRQIGASRLSVAILLACFIVSWTQVGYWRNGSALFGRALDVTPNNWFAHTMLGEELMDAGKFDEAETNLREAMRLRPNQSHPWLAYGRLLMVRGRHAEARALFTSSFARMSGPAASQRADLLRYFQNHVQAFPDSPETHYHLANALSACDRPLEAIEAMERVLALRADYATARVDLGALLAGQGKLEPAIAHYREALKSEPTNALAHANLGGLLSDRGQLDEALIHLAEATRLQPANLATRYNLALALAKRGRHADAVAQLRAVLRAQPTNANALNRLAWLLATSTDDAVHNGTEALTLAVQLQQLTGRKQAMAFDTEAAALAACGRFDEAVAVARQGLDLATAAKAESLAAGLGARLKLYEGRSAVREPASNPTPP